MMKSKVYQLYILVAMMSFYQLGYTQSNNVVTIDGKQFKLNGGNFYPMVMNYGVEITKQSGGGWTQSHITPYIEYGVNSGPTGSTYSYECTDQTLCLSSIEDDWTYLEGIGFNTIRVAGFYPKYDEQFGFFYFNCRAAYNVNSFYKIPVNPFNATDPGLIFILDQYESLMQVANTVGVKLIFNMIGAKSNFLSKPGNNNDEIEYYNAFLNKLSSRVASLSNLSHTVLAYDLWNEPCYHDASNDKTKQQTCEIIDMWYNTVKSHGPTPLVTLGTCGSGDEWFYDPTVIKVDFHSLHVYPHWQSYEDKTDPTMQQRALSRIYDELYWFNKASPVPWIMGEIGFTASANLSVQPIGGTNGTLQEQANFAQAVMDATCNCGGSGFSWWAFQDGYWNTTDPGSNHYGMLERGYVTPASSGGGLPEKLVANVFNSYIKPLPVSSCGPCPVTAADLQTYDPALTYFNPFQHPPNPSNTIKGYVYDQDGNPIANAYVGGHTNLGKNNSNIQEFEFQRVFTAENGYFELIPFDYYTNSTVTVLEGKLITLGITSAGGERYKYSEHYWTICNCSLTMPSANINHTWNLDRVNFAYEGDYNNINILNGENRILEAYSNLTVSNCTLNSGATTEIMARNAIRIKSESHAFAGSSVHIHCATTEVDCDDYAGYSMQYKLNSSNMPLSKNDERFINLEFNSDSISNEFAIFPNPASTHYTIVRNQNYPVEMKVYSIIGEFIESFILTSEKSFINAKSYNRGLYLIKNNSTGQVQKLILQ